MRFYFDFFVDDLFHGADQDVDHDELSVEGSFDFGEQEPLEAEVESLAVQEVLESLDAENGVAIFEELCNLVDALNVDLLDGAAVGHGDQGVLQLHLRGAVVGDDEGVASDNSVSGCTEGLVEVVAVIVEAVACNCSSSHAEEARLGGYSSKDGLFPWSVAEETTAREFWCFASMSLTRSSWWLCLSASGVWRSHSCLSCVPVSESLTLEELVKNSVFVFAEETIE